MKKGNSPYNKESKGSYNLRELASLLGCGMSTVRNNTAKGLIPSIKVGAKLVYPKHIIDRWIEAQVMERSREDVKELIKKENDEFNTEMSEEEYQDLLRI